jgi:hypothetical protein
MITRKEFQNLALIEEQVDDAERTIDSIILNNIKCLNEGISVMVPRYDRKIFEILRSRYNENGWSLNHSCLKNWYFTISLNKNYDTDKKTL